MPSTTNADHDSEVEWFNVYQYAYRISHENHAHLKSWLTKIPFLRLIAEIDDGYLKNIDYGSDRTCDEKLIRSYLQEAIEKNDPQPLIRAYTEKTRFYAQLNRDLAVGGSNFRFEISYAMSNLLYSDDEPPHGFGHYIFAAIASHHSKLQPYRRFTGLTYRGVIMNKSDFQKYTEGLTILNRTFLSTSTDRQVAESFLLDKTDSKSSQYCRVLCLFHIRNPSTTLDLSTLSAHPAENEILIIPFKTFKIGRVIERTDNTSFVELDELKS